MEPRFSPLLAIAEFLPWDMLRLKIALAGIPIMQG
jgi:hypothetical protein